MPAPNLFPAATCHGVAVSRHFLSELVAALWPNRWLALLRRLTVLPFEGLLYLARLGAAATGCRGWQLDVGLRGHVARARHHVPRALTHRSLGALVRARAVRAHLHPGRRWTGDLHAMEKKQSLHKAFPLGNVFSYYQSNREVQENSEVCEAEAIWHFLDLFHPDTRNEQLHRPGVQEIRSNLQNKFAFCSLTLSTKRVLLNETYQLLPNSSLKGPLDT
eukprot:bmy_20009T0